MSRPILNPAQVARIKAAYRLGIPASLLGKIFGINDNNIYNWAAGTSCSSVAPDQMFADRLKAFILNGE